MFTTDWKTREVKRSTDGSYKLVPWAKEPWVKPLNHFPHMSAKQPGLIAYTQNDYKGRADVQTPIKPGAYLKKYYGKQLASETIANWANQARSNAPPTATSAKPIPAPPVSTLHICTTTEECIAAYKTGPNSCMSFAAGGYLGKMHPASIYGGESEITVAILRRDGRITARCLCWPERKLFYRSGYGDTMTLFKMLEAESFQSSNQPPFHGARLRAIPHEGGRYVAPMIDGHPYAKPVYSGPQGSDLAGLQLITPEEFNSLPTDKRVRFGYYQGLSSQ